ncbi:unnamed protein product [Lactuca virosa]|uniref:F-box associated beta-propeller type 3 domain-containing protein n=1 Tax=Lactuca virosa TaxID=75947 RepID=A0AAU9MS89_9ASTR|nr:unnamed protein product [Lactuca virosa]
MASSVSKEIDLLKLRPPYYNDSIKILFRFGFDPRSDDYKVIKLTGVVREHRNISPFNGPLIKDWLQVEVYSMRKGTWELISQKFPSHVISIALQDEVCVDGHDGHLHWLANIQENVMKQTIVAFDLGVETFCEILLPNSMHDYNVHHRNVLGVLGGKLCVMSGVRDGGCEVWVMDEYGVVESWVKLMRLVVILYIHMDSHYTMSLSLMGF